MVYIWLYFLRKYLTWRAGGGKKTKKSWQRGGWRADGEGWRADRAAGTAAAGRGGAGGAFGAE